jgi:hypothetical protein
MVIKLELFYYIARNKTELHISSSAGFPSIKLVRLDLCPKRRDPQATCLSVAGKSTISAEMGSRETDNTV